MFRSTAGMRSSVQPSAYVVSSSSMRSRRSVTPSTSVTAYPGTGGSACASRSFAVIRTSVPRRSDSYRMSSARFRALRRAERRSGCSPLAGTSVVHAADVPAVAGVDLDLLAGAHEQRHLDSGAGLQLGRLGAAGGAVALQTRVGVLDDQLDTGRQFDVERSGVVQRDDDLGVLQQVVGVAAHRLGRDVDLVVGVGVHEDEVGALLVQVGHAALVDVGGLDLGAG